MRTTKIKVFALIAIVGMAFMGCQKDELNKSNSKEFKIEGEVIIPKTGTRKLKFGTDGITKSTVKDYYTCDGNPRVYKTVIIGNQEWLAEDWDSDYADGFCDEEFGAYRCPYNNKMYYEWNVLDGTAQSTWDTCFKDKPGFHIPTYYEILALLENCSKKSEKLKAVLKLETYEYVWSGKQFGWTKQREDWPNQFWMQPSGYIHPNATEGCGLVYFPAGSDVGISSTNMLNYGVRVRLVREVN